MPKILSQNGIKIVNYSEICIDDLIELNKSFREMNIIFKEIEELKK